MFSSPFSRAALGCSKRLKIASPFRPLSTTNARLSESDVTLPKEAEKPAEVPPQPELQPQPTKPQSQPQPEAAAAPPTQIPVKRLPITPKPWAERMESLNDGVRLPRNVQALYFKPLKRKAEYGLPACDLQLRSYSIRNLEFFADFCLRAAYYLGLPASGPVPLPRITERWTVIKSPFIFKKVQENFERITLRRLIQIKDGQPEVVQAWLAFIRKHAYHGVGMKANVWEHAPLDFAQKMDVNAKDIEKQLEADFARFGLTKSAKPKDSISKLIETERYSNKQMPLTTVRKG